MRWNDPVWGFYGHSLAERILPHQALLNRRQWQITTSLDKKANPMVWVHKQDQNLAFKTFSQVGLTVGSYKVSKPEGVDYQAVGRRRTTTRSHPRAGRARDRHQPDDGVRRPCRAASRAARACARRADALAALLDPGARLRAVHPDTMWLVIAMCKKLGPDKVPDVLHVEVRRRAAALLKWKDVNLDDLKYEMAVASAVANTPAGRQQRVTELAQAGIITLDEARELIAHPDIDRILALQRGDRERAVGDRADRERRDGITPEPFMNLKMCVTMAQREYLLIQTQAT
jgi:hypothetical protein